MGYSALMGGASILTTAQVSGLTWETVVSCWCWAGLPLPSKAVQTGSCGFILAWRVRQSCGHGRLLTIENSMACIVLAALLLCKDLGERRPGYCRAPAPSIAGVAPLIGDTVKPPQR